MNLANISGGKGSRIAIHLHPGMASSSANRALEIELYANWDVFEATVGTGTVRIVQNKCGGY
jgi:hypothetical protein